jgi:hypothetical protein
MPWISSLSLTTASRDDLPILRSDITTMDCPNIRLSIDFQIMILDCVIALRTYDLYDFLALPCQDHYLVVYGMSCRSFSRLQKNCRLRFFRKEFVDDARAAQGLALRIAPSF